MIAHRYISSALCHLSQILLAAVMAISCSSDTPVADPEPAAPGQFQVGFMLSVGNTQPSPALSRAPLTPEGGYDRGQAYENWIDIDNRDFRFWFFDDESNTFLTELDILTIAPVETSVSSKTYSVEASITLTEGSFDPRRQNFKVMVLANWKNYPTPAPGTHIDDIVRAGLFTFTPDSDLPSASSPIPLYGIREYTSLVFGDSKRASLGRIHLLRAYSKVEVLVDRDKDPFSHLTSVTLRRYSSSGYSAPFGIYTQDAYVHDDYTADYTGKPNIPDGALTDNTLPFHPSGAGSYIIYIPEYDNTSIDPSDEAYLTLTFSDTDDPYTIFFRKKQDNHLSRFDILRNVWYRFLVNRKHTVDGEIEVDIQPYAEQWLMPDLGLMRDEMGDIMIELDKDEDGKYTLPEYFREYMETYGKQLPFPLSDIVDGDYYAIHLTQDGEMKHAEIWLKDSDGAHVIENFSHRVENDQFCSTRLVDVYFGTEPYRFHKDRYGDRRIYHFPNHWTIGLDRKDFTIFKSEDNTIRYEVASFDKDEYDKEDSDKVFYIYAKPKEDDEYYYVIKVKDGIITDEKESIKKNGEPSDKDWPSVQPNL